MDQAVKQAVRTLLISDVHLGCKHAQAGQFLRFLDSYHPEKLYIVGDFIDAWKINSGWYWSDECHAIVQRLRQFADAGVEMFYVPGNHDSFLRNSSSREMLPSGFPSLRIANEFVYETLRGWRFLVTHGDLFDFFETRAQWISKATSFAYDSCLSLNWWMHYFLLDDDRNPYGVCASLKDWVKRGVRFVSRFEERILHHALDRGCEGVICGHIHTPDIVQTDSMVYCNTGDWVENCTGLVEHQDGRLQLASLYGENRDLLLPQRKLVASSQADGPASSRPTFQSAEPASNVAEEPATERDEVAA